MAEIGPAQLRGNRPIVPPPSTEAELLIVGVVGAYRHGMYWALRSRPSTARPKHLDLYGKYAHSTGFDLSGLARYTRVVAECGAVRQGAGPLLHPDHSPIQVAAAPAPKDDAICREAY
jgi:hypothetical protein